MLPTAEQQVNSGSGRAGTESEPLTFVFADLVNAARLWEQHADQMAEASPRYDALVRAAVAAGGGRVFQTVGESHYLVFDDAAAAIAAAAELQRRLLAARWDERLGEMRTRLALHSGVGQPRGDDTYFAPQTLNRLSRILAATHGGQIIVSGRTAEQAKGKLPIDIELRAMGVRRLRDLAAPEELYQVVAADLPQSFPPLKTLDTHPSNLPAQPTALLGRERELAELGKRLRQPEVQMLTLSGPGGTGKTRLSLQLAADLLDEYADGCFFVPLAAVSEPALVLTVIAQAVGLREEGGSLAEALHHALVGKRMLLVLDNCEQVVTAAALLGELLAAAPGLRIVATSREPFGLAGEQEYAVPPLELPEAGQRVSAAQVAEYAAVQLFVQRAQAVKYDFTLDDADATTVVEICRQLDGLPLAIELAAARVRQFSIAQLLAGMSSRLALLRSNTRDRTARQQSLEGMVAWSYELLDAEERELFRRFAIFVGGADADAVTAVCDSAGELRAANNLVHLAYKSLLRQDEVEGAASRYTMLQTIRDFAMARLQEGDYAATATQHATYYCELAEAAANELRGPEQATWLNRLEQEHDNLRAAIAWFVARADEAAGLRMGKALWWFWWLHGHLSEGRRLLEAILQIPTSVSDPTAPSVNIQGLRAGVLSGLGNLTFQQGDFLTAQQSYEQAHALHQAMDDQYGIAVSLNNLGNIAAQLADYQTARRLFEQSLAIKRRLNSGPAAISSSLHNLSNIARALGELDAARQLNEESLALRREVNDPSSIASTLISLGEIELCQARYDKAAELYAECLTIAERLASKSIIAQAAWGLGLVNYSLGDYGTARQHLNYSLNLSRESGYEVQEAYALVWLGNLYQAEGDLWAAQPLLLDGLRGFWRLGHTPGVVDALTSFARSSIEGEKAIGWAVSVFAAASTLLPLINWLPVERTAYEQSLLRCEATLGKAEFDAAWQLGLQMDTATLVADILHGAAT